MLISLFIPLFFYSMHLLVTNFSANFLNPFHLQTYFAFECLSKSYLKYDSKFERKRDKCSEVKVCVDANVYIISDHASKTYLSDSSNSFYLLDSIINDDALKIYCFGAIIFGLFFSCQFSFFNLTLMFILQPVQMDFFFIFVFSIYGCISLLILDFLHT